MTVWRERATPVDVTTRVAETMLEIRRARGTQLPGELFGEPAWEMLLVLFVADARGERLTRDALFDLFDVSAGTSARWLRFLSSRDLVTGDTDDVDSGGVLITPKALHAVEDWICRLQRLFEARWGANFDRED